MAAIAEQLSLRWNEFAFHFDTDNGVAVDMLATFLRRAATVARSHGADLRVVGVRTGSLVVTLAAVRKGVANEFTDRPIDTTVKTSGFVVAIVAAIVAAMSPQKSGISPMVTAGVELVDRHEVTQITIVTRESNAVVMDEDIARHVREARVHGEHAPAQTKTIAGHISQHVVALDERARRGDLSGEVVLVEGDLHFRPDGYKFLVPVETAASHGIRDLSPSKRYRVTGHMMTVGGQPDHIVVGSAVPL